MLNRKKYLLIIAAVFLSACDKLIEDFKKGYDEAYVSAYKTSFMESCTEEDTSPEHKALCLCIVEDLIVTYNSDDLNNEEKVIKHIEEISVEKCSTSKKAE